MATQGDDADTPFKDFSDSAAWRETVFRPPQPAPSAQPFFTIPGVGLYTLALDSMHVLDLGVLQHTIGNV